MAIHKIFCKHGCGTKLGTIELPDGVDPTPHTTIYYAKGHEPFIQGPEPSVLTPDQQARMDDLKARVGNLPLTGAHLSEIADILLRR